MSIGGFVPKPHTPFQWAAQCDHETVDARLAKLQRCDPPRPGVWPGHRLSLPRWEAGHHRRIVESRGPTRRRHHRGRLADGARFDGWSEHFSYERWASCAERCLESSGVDLDWYTTRERDYAEVLPWDHLDCRTGSRVALGGLAGRLG